MLYYKNKEVVVYTDFFEILNENFKYEKEISEKNAIESLKNTCLNVFEFGSLNLLFNVCMVMYA